MGKIAYRHATNHDYFRTPLRVYAARCFGRMGSQLDIQLGSASFLFSPRSRLVRPRLAASFNRSSKNPTIFAILYRNI